MLHISHSPKSNPCLDTPTRPEQSPMILTGTQMIPATFSPGWRFVDEPGAGNLVFPASEQSLGNLPDICSWPGALSNSYHCAGQGLEVRGEQGSRAPRNNKIFNSDKKFGGAGRFSVVWKVKTPKPLWGFERTFSLMLWTSDRGGGEKLQGHLKNRREKSLATLLSSIGSKDSILFFR